MSAFQTVYFTTIQFHFLIILVSPRNCLIIEFYRRLRKLAINCFLLITLIFATAAKGYYHRSLVVICVHRAFSSLLQFQVSFRQVFLRYPCSYFGDLVPTSFTLIYSQWYSKVVDSFKPSFPLTFITISFHFRCPIKQRVIFTAPPLFRMFMSHFVIKFSIIPVFLNLTSDRLLIYGFRHVSTSIQPFFTFLSIDSTVQKFITKIRLLRLAISLFLVLVPGSIVFLWVFYSVTNSGFRSTLKALFLAAWFITRIDRITASHRTVISWPIAVVHRY